MARVFEARLSGLHGFEKRLAVKMILPEFADDKEFVTMLIDEAKIAVALGHSNICQVHDFGCIDGIYYLATEYIDGADLLEVVNRSLKAKVPIDYDAVAEVGKAICAGLDYAHAKRDEDGNPLKIIHRDVSPANILISMAGQVKIVDFGMAKAARRSQETSVGVIKGKYQYMSPEQILGRSLDHRSDIFAVGIVLYETIAGRMMYRDGPDLFHRVQLAQRRPLNQIRADLPTELDSIINKALSRKPHDRYDTAGEMGEALDEFRLHFQSKNKRNRLDDLMTRLFSSSKTAPVRRSKPKRSLRKPPRRSTLERPANDSGTIDDAPPRPKNDTVTDDRTHADPRLLEPAVRQSPLVIIEDPKTREPQSPLPRVDDDDDDEGDGATVASDTLSFHSLSSKEQTKDDDWNDIPETSVVPPLELPRTSNNDSLVNESPEPTQDGETTVWTQQQGAFATQVNIDVDLSAYRSGGSDSAAGFFLVRESSGKIKGPVTRAQLRHMAVSAEITHRDEVAPLWGVRTPDDLDSLSWTPAGVYVADTDTEFEARAAVMMSASARVVDIATQPVARLFFQLASEQLDGIVIFNGGRVRKQVTLLRGRPTYVSSTTPDEQLGIALVTLGLVSKSNLSRALQVAVEQRRTLADTLIALDILDERTVMGSLKRLVRARLLELFGWREGKASIHSGTVEEAPVTLSIDPVRVIKDGILYSAGAEGSIGWLWQREEETFILTGDSKNILESLGVSPDALSFLDRFGNPMNVREAIEVVVREHLNGDDIANAIMIAFHVGYIAAVVE